MFASFGLLMPINIPKIIRIPAVIFDMRWMQVIRQSVLQISYEEAITVAKEVRETQSIVVVLVVVWLTGVILIGGYFLYTHLRWRTIYKTALPIESQAIIAWRQENDLRKGVQIRQLDQITAPLTYGIKRPVILLPKALSRIEDRQLDIILQHEYMHIKRYDVLLKWILMICVSIHWFNPFVWVMYVLANRDIEISCDEAVMARIGKRKTMDYAMTLLSTYETSSVVSLLSNSFCMNGIEERVRIIAKRQKRTKKYIVQSMICICAVFIISIVRTEGVFHQDEVMDNAVGSYCLYLDISQVQDIRVDNGLM